MAVTIARLRELIALAASEGVGGIDVVEDGTRIRIARTGAAPVRAGLAAEPKSALSTVVEHDVFTAPMFGVLHLTPAPGAASFVKVGDFVVSGQQLCLIEAMKMFNPVLSDRAGRIKEILAEPGTEVTSGQPLFRIRIV